ncbi:MAG: hypothetical protein WCE52_12630 [Candidatus Acidiferrum sp.]
MKMKLWHALVLSTVMLGSAFAQKPSAKQPFTLTLSAGPTESLGSGVWVKVQWTNTSDQALDAIANVLDATIADPNFVFEFLDKSGRPVPRKMYKFPETSGHAEFGTLGAGESITKEVNLLRLFELKQPGKYALQVSRLVPKALGGGSVKSNKIKISVEK